MQGYEGSNRDYDDNAPQRMDAQQTTPAGGAQQGRNRTSQFVEGKVFVGGLSNDTTTAGLKAYAEAWGPVKDIHVMGGKGYGFITFEEVSSAQEFLDRHEHDIDGRVAEAKAAVPKDQGGSRLSKKMFVGGIGDVSDEEFSSYFSRFGPVVSSMVMRRPDGTSRNYGFVTYESERTVEKCLVQLHWLAGRQVQVHRANPPNNANAGTGDRDRDRDRGAGGDGRQGGGTSHGGGGSGPSMPSPSMPMVMPMPGAMGGPQLAMRDPAAMLAMQQMQQAAMMSMPGMGMFPMVPGMGLMPGMMMPGAPGPNMMPGPSPAGPGMTAGMMPGLPMMMGQFPGMPMMPGMMESMGQGGPGMRPAMPQLEGGGGYGKESRAPGRAGGNNRGPGGGSRDGGRGPSRDGSTGGSGTRQGSAQRFKPY